MQDENKYGILLNSAAKLHRQYFREMVKLLGIKVLYRAPLPDKHYTTYAEIDSNYAQPIIIGCIFEDHPNQQTLQKMGWVSELQENASIIHVDYDLPDIQQGALFIVPSGIDNAKGRLFRVTKLQNSMVYPSSLICEIVPEYLDNFEPEAAYDYSHGSFTLLDEDHMRVFLEDEPCL